MAELKTAYSGQAPKSDDEVSEVDELIQNANRLIESVYRDMNMSGISRRQAPINTSSVQAPTQRQLEIQRIHQFCDNIDEEMRPVLRQRCSGSAQARCTRSPNNIQPVDIVRVNMNTTFLQDDSNDNILDNTVVEQNIQRNTNNSSNVRASIGNAVNGRRNSTTNPSGRRNSVTEPVSRRILNTAFVSNAGRANITAVAPNTNSTADDFVDLSNIPSTISINSVESAPHAGNTAVASVEDDDVIIVSCDLVDVVDLCTPGREEDNQRPAATTNTETTRNRRSINRQSRHQVNSPSRLSYRSRSPLQTISEMMGSRSVQTSTTHIQQPQLQRQLFLAKSVSSSESAGVGAVTATPSNHSLNSSGSSSDRSILMCPVCMESSVKRKPTSTKCGHVFCESCIQQALRLTHKCPMCNTKLNNRMLFRIYL